jgi:hypothetical protein
VTARSTFVGWLAMTFVAALSAQACKGRTEFFPLPRFVEEGGCTDPKRPGAYGFRREPIVVANPPSDREEIERVLEAYNRKTLTDEELDAKCSYKRTFYRETKYTPRNYVEGNHDFTDHDRFEDHYKDILVTVDWEGGHGSAVYTFFADGEPVR